MSTTFIGGVLIATGLGTLLAIPLMGHHVKVREAQAGPTAVAAVSVVLVLAGAWLFWRVDRVDRRFKRQAADLAEWIDKWLSARLQDDPLPLGTRKMHSPGLVQAHNQLWRQVGYDFVDTFGPEVRSWGKELQRNQIRFAWPTPYLGPGDVRTLVRELRSLSRLVGPLPRGS